MKILDNYLDKYFTREAMEILKQRTAIYGYDKKIVNNKEKQRYEYYIKHCKENEDDYEVLIYIRYVDGLDRYIYFSTCDTSELLEHIKRITDKQAQRLKAREIL